LAGYQPALDSCKRCGFSRREHGGARWYFSPLDGGVLCGLCARSRKDILPLGTAALAALNELQEEKSDGLGGGPLPAAVLGEIRFIIQRFLQCRMDREIRSAAFLSRFVAV
jgi:recombinational DNA repair protein (RecF pathway)